MQDLPPLWKHQEIAISKAKEIQNMALFMDLGTGKSRTIVEILRDKFNTNKKILRTLIVCPSAIVQGWKREILKYSQIPGPHIHVLDGSLVERAVMYSGMEGIFITNLESFAYEKFSSVVLKKPPNICIIDESHRIKELTAKRTKALVKLSLEMEKLKVNHRYILTGSPVLNTELDLFSQFYFLDGGKTFGKNYFSFRGTYFQDKNAFMSKQNHFPNWVVRKGATEAIKEKIAPLVVLAKKQDCLTLPPLLRHEVDVTLGKEQNRAYLEMKKDFITYINSEAVVANLALTKAMRMSQILSGFLPQESGEPYHFKENPRADVLKSLLEDITPSEKVIVWAVYHADFQTVRNTLTALKINFAEVTGLIKDKQEELLKFETDPTCRVMLASQSAGGTGTQMTQASTAIYYSKGYSLEHDFQSESRNYRGGSEIHQKITRIDLVARGTIDEVILQALRDKKDLSTNILSLKHLL